jgi:hypothetical protein
MKQNNKTIHEDFSSRADVKAGSDRTFGLVFAALFTFIALAPLLKGHDVRWWALGVAVALLAVALKAPKLLSPFNRVWFHFGLALHKIVSPVVLGLMFFVIFSPFALILRMLGKRPLALGFDHTASTYWIARTPPGPLPHSMTQQF